MNRARRSMLVNSLLVLLWLNFVVLWYFVRQATGISEALTSVVFLFSIIGIYGALLAAWVYHNIRIWRKKGPRRGVREVAQQIQKDTLAREILPSVSLKSGQDIIVDVVGVQKIFARPSGQETG